MKFSVKFWWQFIFYNFKLKNIFKNSKKVMLAPFRRSFLKNSLTRSTSSYYKSFRKFYEENKDKRNILFEFVGDVAPYNIEIPNKDICFRNCRKLVMYECNENFVFYWLNPYYFPQVREIYLYSNPQIGRAHV